MWARNRDHQKHLIDRSPGRQLKPPPRSELFAGAFISNRGGAFALRASSVVSKG